MKKISDFIVNHCYVVLLVFIGFTILSFFAFDKVKINYDMANYLPSSSETRKGMDIMEEEFEEEGGTLHLLFDSLTEKEKQSTLTYLESLDGVEEVLYENTEDYNKDGYTLFTLTLESDADSKEATNIYKKIEDHFDEELVETSGSVSDRNRTILPFYVIAIAVFSAFIILEIMSESYLEPVLFLLVILMAVALNKGTNLIFPSVSHVTESIASILQMALSMDYSIMLMNRYRQERETEKDKVAAMRKALHNAFQSISSSSVTTIVGLLALVFMSFTIGRDLGFVLAKGVFFSLLTIFTCLPGLVLLSDKWIFKTKKKSPFIQLDFLGKIEYKGRKVTAILFLVIFLVSFFLKGSLGLLYTESGTAKTEKLFTPNNQMAIIYPNSLEEEFANYCKSLEEKEGVEEVLCYGNTIDDPVPFDKVNAKLKELGSEVEIEEYLLKILYYHYAHPEEENQMTLADMITFLKENVYQKEEMNQKIDATMKENIDRLSYFSTTSEVTKKRTVSEIASLFHLEKEKVEDLLTYYRSFQTDTKLSLSRFATFMNQSILTNPKYSVSIDLKTKESLSQLTTFTDTKKIQKALSSKDMASLLGLKEKDIESLYLYYQTQEEMTKTIPFRVFLQFLQEKIVPNPTYSSSLSETATTILNLLTLTDENYMDQEMSSSSIASSLGIDSLSMSFLTAILYPNEDMIMKRFSPYQFVMDVSNHYEEIVERMSSFGLDSSRINTLITLGQFMNLVKSGKELSYQEMSTYLSLDNATTKNLYILYFDEQVMLSPYQFVTFLLNHQKDDALKNALTKDTIQDLVFLKELMESALENKQYAKKDMASFLGMEEEEISLIYALYDKLEKKVTSELSFQEFVSFLLNKVVPNSQYEKELDTKTKDQLVIVEQIIQNTLSSKKYTKEEMFNLLVPLSPDLEKDLLDLVFLYYGSEKEYDSSWTLTIEELVRYLNEEIIKDSRFDDYLEGKRENIIDAKETIADAKNLLLGEKHSRIVINTKLEPEAKETFELVRMIEEEMPDQKDSYLIGDSPMAYEMSRTFQDELNFITILTMLFIFIVVAITFHSFLIPILLVLLIQSAVFLTMGILSFSGSIYFISILIVQSILMGATIDYAILYTSYYLEARKKMDVKDSLIFAYNHSIHTILTSASILVIVTLIVGVFASAIAGIICRTLSKGTLCSAILILFLLPGVLATFDKLIVKKK